MALIITTKEDFNPDGSSSGGTSDHSHSNLSTLNSLRTDNNGNLLFKNKAVGENAVELSYNLTLNQQHILNKFIELPEDCDTKRAITFTLESVPQIKGTDWEVIEKNLPEKDRVSWDGLNLEHLIQVGDKANITYYKKN